MTYKLPKESAEKLNELADYLLKLPKDYEHFNMSVFCDDEYIHVDEDNKNIPNKCGTAACALGHTPYVGELSDVFMNFMKNHDLIMVDLDHNGKLTTTLDLEFIDWETLSYEVYGISDDFNTQTADLWTFMFSGNWDRVDNTIDGAAARIKYVIKYGKSSFVSKIADMLNEYEVKQITQQDINRYMSVLK